MSYEVIKSWPVEDTENGYSMQQLIKLDKKHAVVLFKESDVILTDYFIFGTGWMDASEVGADYSDYKRVEVTRLLASCKDGHDHGVYYQAPSIQELWETMFAIGETNVVMK